MSSPSIILDRIDALLQSFQLDSARQLRHDLAALQFQLRDHSNAKPIIVILGGTGTGKSTLVNRLLGSNLSAANFRRTFTAGPVAIVSNPDQLPQGWMSLPHEASPELPARGQNDKLILVPSDSDLVKNLTLVDTPDLDGDQPIHHALADRAFRWANAILFLVSPEKYQMNELLPYYRLAERYHLPRIFAMNKTESAQQLADYQSLLAPSDQTFAIARDDAAYQPPADQNLDALKRALTQLRPTTQPQNLRCQDFAGRLMDQLIGPLKTRRSQFARAIQSLAALDAPTATIDVHPLTAQLQQRMRERSVLYLIGPQRVFDRIRQVPSLLARLPRTAWDLFKTGKASIQNPSDEQSQNTPPDFRAIAVDHFTIFRSRVDDLLRSSKIDSTLLASDEFKKLLIDPDDAGKIVDDELAQLKQWLNDRAGATPRDTALLEKLLKILPGGKKLTQLSESAPYLLAVVVATHHAFFGHIDLAILGTWSLITWLTERLSNEVNARAQETNMRIAQRIESLTSQQLTQLSTYLNQHQPPEKVVKELEHLATQLTT